MSIDIYTYIHFTFIFIGSFVLTYHVIPKIIGVITYKQLMDHPNERSSHTYQTPSLGGIAFYITLVIGIFFIQDWDMHNISISLLVGLVVLFIIGLKDDLVVLSPKTKFIAQLIAISFLLYNSSFHIQSFHGFLGIYEVSTWITIPLSAFVMLSIINAYNLIDGIDGLACVVGILFFTFMGLFFFVLGELFFAAVSVIMTGVLFSFLFYNVSKKNKIFMGDTGSLIVGYLIGALVVKLFSFSSLTLEGLPIQTENIPLVILSILFIPIFDTTRVCTIRILQKKSPFSPDRNHIHHLLIDCLQISHRRTSFFLGLYSFTFILTIIFLAGILNQMQIALIFISFTLFNLFILYKINTSLSFLKKRSNNVQRIVLENIISTDE